MTHKGFVDVPGTRVCVGVVAGVVLRGSHVRMMASARPSSQGLDSNKVKDADVFMVQPYAPYCDLAAAAPGVGPSAHLWSSSAFVR